MTSSSKRKGDRAELEVQAIPPDGRAGDTEVNAALRYLTSKRFSWLDLVAILIVGAFLSAAIQWIVA